MLNHNLETVARLQRAVRPSAGYARSLAVLGRAKAAGLVTKSGLILGMGETDDEVRAAMADLRAVGVDIVTHRPVPAAVGRAPAGREVVAPRRVRGARATTARRSGFAHVESGPLVRSSYHAREGVGSVGLARRTEIMGAWPSGSLRCAPISRSGGREQPMFFVATAPSGDDGHVNLLAQGLRHAARARAPTGSPTST